MNTRSWLFVRGSDSVRIVLHGPSIAVYGPGRRFTHSLFDEELDATLQQAALEQSLVVGGWTLEQLTTERRSPHGRPEPPGGIERRRSLRLVPPLPEA